MDFFAWWLTVAVAVFFVVPAVHRWFRRRREKRLALRLEPFWRREMERLREEQIAKALTRTREVGPNQYRCTGCGKVYDKGRSDSEAMAAALEVFGTVLNADGPPCIVCDVCYNAIMGDDSPRLEPRA